MGRLTPEQREELEKSLNARADVLRSAAAEALDQPGDGTRALVNHSEETDDDAIVDLESALDVAALERDSLELRAIEAALARLHTSTYGECVECASNIPFARLQATPTAIRCTPCQSIHERTHAGTGHATL